MLRGGAACQPARDIQVNRQSCQCVSHHIVQVACNPQSLGEPRTVIQYRLCRLQLRVGTSELVARNHLTANQLRGTYGEQLESCAAQDHQNLSGCGFPRTGNQRQCNQLSTGCGKGQPQLQQQGELPGDDHQQPDDD